MRTTPRHTALGVHDVAAILAVASGCEGLNNSESVCSGKTFVTVSCNRGNLAASASARS